MKILAIYFDLGGGVCTIHERLIAVLAENATVDILSNRPPKEGATIPNIRAHYHIPITKKMQSWTRKFIRWFGTMPVAERWSRQAEAMVAKDYDIVMAFCSSACAQLTTAVCAKYLAGKLGCKFGAYSFDAIPGPRGWTKRRRLYNGKKRVVRHLFTTADYFAAANKHMLEYQLQTFEPKAGLQTSVLYTTPTSPYHTNPISEKNIFLYTGSIYGMRNPDHLLKAFKRLLKEYPDAKLVLVGQIFKLKRINNILTPEEQTHIEIHPHTSDLSKYFADAKVLIDMDGDAEKDPFLSSKIASYLKVKRMIVCETGSDTPSRELFKGLNTIVQCSHNADSMYEGMLKALQMAAQEQDYSERQPLIDLFSIESVGKVFWNDIQKLHASK